MPPTNPPAKPKSPLKSCPACHAALVPGRLNCISCGMPVAKMNDFLAAKRLAESRGLRTTTTTEDGDDFVSPYRAYLKPALIAGILLIAVGGLYFLFRSHFGPPPQPWLAFPTNSKDVVTQLFSDIHEDSDASADHAYSLLSLQRRATDSDDERGHYHQLFHEINKYLAGEFGSDWNTRMDITPANRDNPDTETLFTVTVRTETLHVDLEPQLPPKGPPPSPAHFGLVDIREFATLDTARAAQMGIIKGVIGKGSAEQLSGIIGTTGDFSRETPMDTKRRILPILREPHATGIKRAVYHSWPVRSDPTVRPRLTSMQTDARYAPDVQHLAQQALDSNIPEEELIAAGVSRIE